jgi:hypothetical protein
MKILFQSSSIDLIPKEEATNATAKETTQKQNS